MKLCVSSPNRGQQTTSCLGTTSWCDPGSTASCGENNDFPVRLPKQSLNDQHWWDGNHTSLCHRSPWPLFCPARPSVHDNGSIHICHRMPEVKHIRNLIFSRDKTLASFINILIFFTFTYLYVLEGYTCVGLRKILRDEFAPSYVSPKDWTEVGRLGDKHLYLRAIWLVSLHKWPVTMCTLRWKLNLHKTFKSLLMSHWQ